MRYPFLLFLLTFVSLNGWTQPNCGQKNIRIERSADGYRLVSNYTPAKIFWKKNNHQLKYRQIDYDRNMICFELPGRTDTITRFAPQKIKLMNPSDSIYFLHRETKFLRRKWNENTYRRIPIEGFIDTSWVPKLVKPNIFTMDICRDNNHYFYILADTLNFPYNFRPYIYRGSFTSQNRDSVYFDLNNRFVTAFYLNIVSKDNDSCYFNYGDSLYVCDFVSKKISSVYLLMNFPSNQVNFDNMILLGNYIFLNRKITDTFYTLKINRLTHLLESKINTNQMKWSYANMDGLGRTYVAKPMYTSFGRDTNKLSIIDYDSTYLYSFNLCSDFHNKWGDQIVLDCNGNLEVMGEERNITDKNLVNPYKIGRIYSKINDTINIDLQCDTLTAIVVFVDGDTATASYIPCRYRTIDTIVCDLLKYKSRTYPLSGIYQDTIRTASSDTITTLRVTVLPTIRDTTFIQGCDSLSYLGKYYYESQSLKQVKQVQQRCDSFQTIAISIGQSSRNSRSLSSCEPILWNGKKIDSSGLYILRLTSKKGCDSIEELQFKLGINAKVNVLAGYTLEAVEDSMTYQWYLCNPWRKIVNEKGKRLMTTTTGQFAVEISSKDGCKDTSECYATSLSSISNTFDAKYSVYPNPSKGLFYLTTPLENKPKKVIILTVEGKKIFESNSFSNSMLILDLSMHPKGLYFLIVESGNQIYQLKIHYY